MWECYKSLQKKYSPDEDNILYRKVRREANAMSYDTLISQL